MKKAIAIALRKTDYPAIKSARNFFWLIADFMYGTPERRRMTYVFVASLALLGFTMQAGDTNTLAVCVN